MTHSPYVPACICTHSADSAEQSSDIPGQSVPADPVGQVLLLS